MITQEDLEPIHVTTIGDLLRRAVILAPDRKAVVFPDSSITYARLLDRSYEVARALYSLGVRRGDRVGLFLPNSLDFLRAFFGTCLLGATVVPLNIRHKSTEIGYIIADGELRALLTSNADTSHIDPLGLIAEALPSAATAANPRCLNLPEAPHLRFIIDLGGPGNRFALTELAMVKAATSVATSVVQERARSVSVRDNAMILYTSGTTANPKGCMLSHEAVMRGPSERANLRLKVPGVDVTWAAGPLFHIGSLAPFIGSVSVAGTFLADNFFDAARALKLLKENKVTLAWPWFSAIVQALLDHPDFRSEDFSSLRHFFLIAPPTLVARVREAFPHAEILQACGMTETAGVFALSDRDESAHSRDHTQGKASPGVEIRIVDPETGEDCRDGDMGEIWVRGYCVMDGYFRNPEQSALALGDDGWLRTGDLYIRHEDGSLVFQGRLKDMLKVGGENVATMEVEAFLCSHPAVKLAEVVGKPDVRLDEVPVAFLELEDGQNLSEDEVIAFCKGKIANYKIPREVRFITAGAWPMSATKVDKRTLRAMLQESP